MNNLEAISATNSLLLPSLQQSWFSRSGPQVGILSSFIALYRSILNSPLVTRPLTFTGGGGSRILLARIPPKSRRFHLLCFLTRQLLWLPLTSSFSQCFHWLLCPPGITWHPFLATPDSIHESGYSGCYGNLDYKSVPWKVSASFRCLFIITPDTFLSLGTLQWQQMNELKMQTFKQFWVWNPDLPLTSFANSKTLCKPLKLQFSHLENEDQTHIVGLL